MAEIEKLTLPVEAPEEAGGEPGEKPGAGELRRMRNRLQVIRKLSRELLEEL